MPLDLGTARFSYVRVERASDLPAPDPTAVDVAVLDMNHGYSNVGHDAIVTMIRDQAGALDGELAARGARVRVTSYAVRDRLMVPDHRSGRHLLYVGTGGPGHLDPHRNTEERGTQFIREDPSWEAPLWKLFEDVAVDENAALYGVCHTFGLLCRWSGAAEPVLREEGPTSGVGTNLLTQQALAHPWFAALADGGDARVPVLDSRYYDLIPRSPAFPRGMTAIAYASDAAGKPDPALTMLEVARDRDARTPRIFAVNSHPEIGAAERVAGLLDRMLERGTITREVYDQRSALLPVLRSDRREERLRVGRLVFSDLIERRLERLVRAA